jgi:alkylmercury lyase
MKLEQLADRIAGAAPKLGTLERRIAVTLYRMLAEGKPVQPSRVAESLALPEGRVHEALGSWSGGVFYDEKGLVIGFWGLALSEMPHRLAVEGRSLYTWCALDSLFIPQILQKTARAESTCPVTGEQISLAVGPIGVEQLTPATAVVSLLTPDRSFDDTVRQSFCHFVHFFSSAEAGAVWTAEHPGTFLLSVDEAYRLGRLMNRRIFQDVHTEACCHG